jgi:hypothetical protein
MAATVAEARDANITSSWYKRGFEMEPSGKFFPCDIF